MRRVEIAERTGWFSGAGHGADLAGYALSPNRCVCSDKTYTYPKVHVSQKRIATH